MGPKKVKFRDLTVSVREDRNATSFDFNQNFEKTHLNEKLPGGGKNSFSKFLTQGKKFWLGWQQKQKCQKFDQKNV